MAAERANSTSPAVQWSSHQGKSTYTATGGRDVLFIISDTLPISTHPGICDKAVPRRENILGLNDDEACKLEHQGIARESQDCDLNVMVTRHRLDKRHHVCGVLSEASCGQVKREISLLMSTTDKEGVVVCYIGQGKMDTGDWCFKDGFLSFQDLSKLYRSNPHFQGRVLSIVTDCSYSGHWVRQCMELMDGEGISPCGHSAREKGILIKVLASCQPTEIPKKLSFSVHSANNEKNSGLLAFPTHYKGAQIPDKQQPSGIDFTYITCRRSIDSPCALTKGYSWRKWREALRMQLFSTVENGKPMWYYLLLTEKEDKVREFKEKTETGKCCVKLSEYGRVLMKGIGERPNNEARDYMHKKYLPMYT